MKAIVLINDVGGRFFAGEVGEVLSNDFHKYDYRIELPNDLSYLLDLVDINQIPKDENGDPRHFVRVFYFFHNEIMEVPL